MSTSNSDSKVNTDLEKPGKATPVIRNIEARSLKDHVSTNPSCPAHVVIFPDSGQEGRSILRSVFGKGRLLSNDIKPWLVKLSPGTLMSFFKGGSRISKDSGKSWTKAKSISTGSGPGTVGDGVAVVTTEGVIVLVYLDLENAVGLSANSFENADQEAEAVALARLDVWSIRSTDGGATWTDKQRIFQGYCGALIDIIQTSTGRIVVPAQKLTADPIRNVMRTYSSDDQGMTWRASNVIDLGGQGQHDGAFESTLVELSNGRLLMLIRTVLDRFWEAYSDDWGGTWRELGPSSIESSNSPGFLTRLESGRLILVWNRLFPEGEYSYPRPQVEGNMLSSFASSWHREELSISVSDDEARTWSKPIVVLKGAPGSWFSYPFAIEPEPGQLWVFSCHKERVGLSLSENDILKTVGGGSEAT